MTAGNKNRKLTISQVLVLDHDMLCHVADKGPEWNYNRQLCSEYVNKLPKEHLFPVAFTMEHHHRFFQPCETHMRLLITLPDGMGAADVPMDFYRDLKPYFIIKNGNQIAGSARPISDGGYDLFLESSDKSLASRIKKLFRRQFPDLSFVD